MAREPLRECLCGKAFAGRGLSNHVRYKDDQTHGKYNSLPDDFNVTERPIVGHIDITMDTSNRHPDHERWMCTECWNVFRGKRGIAMHLLNADYYHDDVHGEVDYARHVRFPATKGKKILVPKPAYRHIVHLTDYERDNGWEIVVDESLPDPRESGDTSVHPEAIAKQQKVEILDKLKEEF